MSKENQYSVDDIRIAVGELPNFGDCIFRVDLELVSSVDEKWGGQSILMNITFILMNIT